MRGHDSDLFVSLRRVLEGMNLALFWGDDTGTIGSNETGFTLRFENGGNSGHVMLRDTFRNSNDQGNFCSNSLSVRITCPTSLRSLHPELLPQLTEVEQK